MKVRCQRFALDNVPRSSHSVSVVNNQLYVFGGEVQPRTPVEAAVYASELGQSGQAKHSTIAKADESSPTARVGHAAAVIGQNFYVFGGRGGKDMAPLKEEGRVWQFSTESQVWTALDPTDKSVFPEARSYHSATSDRSRYLYTHGGCPASGRTSDVYRFDVTTRKWEQLPSAPDPPRGGPGFTYGLGKLWRLGGFDGKNELGGQLDYLDVSSANQAWKSVTFDSNACPGPRSVTGLQVVTTNGTNHLVAFLGERDASKIGHEGAGSFWNDVWTLALSEKGEPASKAWTQCTVAEEGTPSRGWFASDTWNDRIVLFGGLNGDNGRESDGFLLSLTEGN